MSVALSLRHCGPDRLPHLLAVRCAVVDVIRLHSWRASRFHPMLFVLSLQLNDATGAESLLVLRVGVVLVAPPAHHWIAGRRRVLSPVSIAPWPALGRASCRVRDVSSAYLLHGSVPIKKKKT